MKVMGKLKSSDFFFTLSFEACPRLPPWHINLHRHYEHAKNAVRLFRPAV